VQVATQAWWFAAGRLLTTVLTGLVAGWLLIFIASVRELGASILLMGPDSKVMTPAIAEAFFSTSSELTAAMALIQTFTVIVALVILFRVARGMTKELA